jgi:hypothetical protein
MAQDQRGRRYDARPKDPAVPPHMANQPGLNKLQKANFAGKNLAASKKIGAGETGAEGGRGSSGGRKSARKATVERIDGKPMKRGRDGLIHGDRVKLPRGKKAGRIRPAKPAEANVEGTSEA